MSEIKYMQLYNAIVDTGLEIQHPNTSESFPTIFNCPCTNDVTRSNCINKSNCTPQQC